MISDTQNSVSFSALNLNSMILSSLERNNFNVPTPVQAEVIPHALNKIDLMGLAQTGTGKTAAFVLPILEKLITNPGYGVKALIVAPTRELVNQIQDAIRMLSPNKKIQSVAIVGGMRMGGQIHAIKKGAQIVVACPGRLLDHIRRRTLILNELEMLVLDEADRMLDMGFQPDLQELLKHIPSTRQTMLFSATMPNELRSLAESFLKNPKIIKLTSDKAIATVDHHSYFVPQDKKVALAVRVLEKAGDASSLVFTRTKRGADKLADRLYDSGVRVAALHGDLSQRQRDRAMTGFRNGDFKVLVATDIAARGLDVSSVGHVVNYDMPDTVETFVHRIGRTGRANRRGEAHTFVTRVDTKLFRLIERNLKTEMKTQNIDGITEEASGSSEKRDPRKGNSRNQRNGKPFQENSPHRKKSNVKAFSRRKRNQERNRDFGRKRAPAR